VWVQNYESFQTGSCRVNFLFWKFSEIIGNFRKLLEIFGNYWKILSRSETTNLFSKDLKGCIFFRKFSEIIVGVRDDESSQTGSCRVNFCFRKFSEIIGKHCWSVKR
jgi:hypothetical protein